MLDALCAPAADPLFGIISRFRADRRPGKIDLVVGVYCDETGTTPTLEAVKTAERELAAEGASKVYRGLSGNVAFNDGMARLLLGTPALLARQVTMQTVGGTGALRMLAEFIAIVSPDAAVWSSDPGYVNHRPLIEAAGLRMHPYRWREVAGGLDMQAFIDDLAGARRGDVILIHGCCHNPTGIDLNDENWAELADICAQRGLVPWVDMAYQGFARGLEEDAAGLRLMAERNETVLIAASCSKNMGLYCERAGVASVVTRNTIALAFVAGTLARIARASYSMPADHGAAVAVRLLDSPTQWHAELQTMRRRIADIRVRLAESLREFGAHPDLCRLKDHSGMFSMLPLDQGQMTRLRSEFAIYGTESGRINLAGLTIYQIPEVARSLLAVVLPQGGRAAPGAY